MHATDPMIEIARFLRRLQWTALAAGVCWLLWLLAPVLTRVLGRDLGGWETAGRSAQESAASRKRCVNMVFALRSMVLLLPWCVVPLWSASSHPDRIARASRLAGADGNSVGGMRKALEISAGSTWRTS